jgi:hypothetical protein
VIRATHTPRVPTLSDLDVRNVAGLAQWRQRRQGFEARDPFARFERVGADIVHAEKLSGALAFLDRLRARAAAARAAAGRPRLAVVR